MAFAQIGVVVPLGDVQKVLKQVGEATADLRPVFRGRVAPDLSSHLRQQYDSRGAHLGTLWAPLSPVTIRLRTRTAPATGGKGVRTVNRAGRAKAGFATPMRDTDRSRRSLVNLTDPEGIRVYNRLDMAWGSRLAYLAPHHEPGGFQTRVFGKGPLRHVPAREVIPAEWPAPILTAWSGWLIDHLGG